MRISDWSSDVCSSDLAADDVERGIGEAVAERHPVFVAVAADEYFHPSAQGIDHADADAVQATGKRVVLAAELAAGMQPGQDQLDAGDAFFGVDIDRHAAAIVDHFATTVGERSEEHTSELQSLMRISYAVFCLKKKKPKK